MALELKRGRRKTCLDTAPRTRVGVEPETEERQIGVRIAVARRAKGMPQRELAAHVGVTIRTIQNYESGATAPHRHLPEIAACTGRTHSWLLYGEGSESPLVERVSDLRTRIQEQAEVLAHHVERLQRHVERLADQRAKRRLSE